jgi:hypothetical protein
VVRYLVGAGVSQFLDIGSGIPTVGNVHEVAQAAAPGARVVYVDTDPVAVAHGQEILADNPHAGTIEGDLRRPEEILGHPAVLGLLDFSRPIGLLLIAVLHFVPDADDPAGIVAGLRGRMAAGSYLAISHGIGVPVEQEQSQQEVKQLYGRTPTPFYLPHTSADRRPAGRSRPRRAGDRTDHRLASGARRGRHPAAAAPRRGRPPDLTHAAGRLLDDQPVTRATNPRHSRSRRTRHGPVRGVSRWRPS